MESVVSQQLSKDLYLLTNRVRIDNQEVSIRIIVYNSKPAFVLVERGDAILSGFEALRSIIEEVKRLTLNVFEITPELIEMHPALREVDKVSESMKPEVGVEHTMEVQTVKTEVTSPKVKS